MKTVKVNFTKQSLQNIRPPVKDVAKSGGVYDVYVDTKEAGLRLLVSNGGAKTFYLYKKINGRPERIKLGAYPDFSVEKARLEAQKVKGAIAGGKNPNIEKNKIKNEVTLSELLTRYIELYAKKYKKSWEEDKGMIKRHIEKHSFKKLSDFNQKLVSQIHYNIAHNLTEKEIKNKRKPKYYAANRVLSLLSVVFNKAIEWGWEGTNPCNNIKAFKETSRDRFLQPDEIRGFFEALEQELNTTAKDFIYIALLTGARKANVLSMRWDEINLDRKEWRIPETKNGESLTITLADQAVRILLKRKKDNQKLKSPSPFVFAGEGEAGHFADPKRAWTRLKKKAGIKDLRLHDLRRTLGSYQASLGANSYIIGKSLGHKSQAATAIYARLNLDPVRASVQLATNEIMRFKNGK